MRCPAISMRWQLWVIRVTATCDDMVNLSISWIAVRARLQVPGSCGVCAFVGVFARVPDRLHYELWSLHLGHVPGGGEHLEAGPVNGARIGLPVGGLDNPVALAPQ